MSSTSPQPSGSSNASRRSFLKTSVAVSGALASGLSVARSAHAAGSDELEIGLVGCGGRGTGAADDTLSINKGVKLVAMADAFSDRLNGAHDQLKKKYDDRVAVPPERKFVGFDAYQKLLETTVDLVIFATPPGFRPIHFEAAVKAGKHIFMEKPVAVDPAGVRKVLEAAKVAKEKNLGVGVGLQRRHQAVYVETIKQLHDGAIGDILFTRVYWNGAGVWVNPRKAGQTEMEYQMRNWYYFNWLCGDHITEQHIHNLDVGNWVMNDLPVTAQGMGGREVRDGKEYGEIYDHHYVEFTYKNGAKMISCCRHIPGCWDSVSEHAHGTKGYCNPGSGRVEGENKWRYRGGGGNPYQVEHLDLVTSIREGKPYQEAEYGATSSMTSILGRMATYSGREVKWDDAIKADYDLSPKEYSFDAAPPVLPDENGNYKIAVPGKWNWA
ncbi:MAG: Gfo/Idh/MocA family oxidoreductase [Pirellulales bacterium]